MISINNFKVMGNMILEFLFLKIDEKELKFEISYAGMKSLNQF